VFKNALNEILGILFTLIFLFQPPLHELYNTRSNAVEVVLNQGIAKASSIDNGYFTPEIIQEMKDNLKQRFFIRDEDIEFRGTTTLTLRGEYIEGTLIVKKTPLWILEGVLGTSPEAITRHATMMSEYVSR